MRATVMGALTLALCLSACGDDDGGGKLPDGGTAADAAQGNVDAAQGNADAAQDAAQGSADAAPQADAGSQNDSAPQADSATEAPTFTSVYDTVLKLKCAPCHTSSSSGGLSMANRNAAYDALVFSSAAGSACGTSGLDRVKPSDAASSLLVKKLEGTPPCGDRMPRNRAALSADEIALVKQWIEAGAKDD